MTTVAGDIGKIPDTDDRNPSALIEEAVHEVLELARTWLAWDGRPIVTDGNVWTPHKALRRVQDHLIDHLAEIECRVAGLPTLPDRWHGRAVTMASDWSPFTETDLEEASSRLSRLGQIYKARVAALPDDVLDAQEDGAWTLRQVVFHVSEVTTYARFVGPLTGEPTSSRNPR